jgi:hypothetical protein
LHLSPALTPNLAHMRKITILCIILMILCSNSIACIQYYVTDSRGERHFHIEDGPERSPTEIHKLTREEINMLRMFENQMAAATSISRYKYISNYCASLIKVGRYKESIPILENLLKTHPDEYEINANLAVAYELNGQLDEALSFIKKSMKLNSNSHLGSEWFHLRIIEAAIVSRDTKLKIQEMDILKIKDDTSVATMFQISYQLKERIPLTKSTNSLLSKVIEECADYYYIHYSIEWAIDLYAIAVGYAAEYADENRLWSKINSSREKLVNLNKKPEFRFKYLYKSGWKKDINKRIMEWRGYSPYYFDGEIKKEFQAA